MTPMTMTYFLIRWSKFLQSHIHPRQRFHVDINDNRTDKRTWLCVWWTHMCCGLREGFEEWLSSSRWKRVGGSDPIYLVFSVKKSCAVVITLLLRKSKRVCVVLISLTFSILFFTIVLQLVMMMWHFTVNMRKHFRNRQTSECQMSNGDLGYLGQVTAAHATNVWRGAKRVWGASNIMVLRHDNSIPAK